MALIDVVTASGDQVAVQSGSGSPSRHVQLSALAASAALLTTGAVVFGWSLIEPTGAAGAVALLIDGASADGDIAGAISIAAGGESIHSTTGRGVLFERGVYVQVVSGTLTGAIYYERSDR
jgi:hypothetical protein